MKMKKNKKLVVVTLVALAALACTSTGKHGAAPANGPVASPGQRSRNLDASPAVHSGLATVSQRLPESRRKTPDLASPPAYSGNVSVSDPGHSINEVGLVVSPTGVVHGSVDVGYAAFMRYPQNVKLGPYLDLVSSGPFDGSTWAVAAPPVPATFVNDNTYNTGDPILVSNPSSSSPGFNPLMVYLIGTTWKSGTNTSNQTDATVHLQNQITVWSNNPNDTQPQWAITQPLEFNTDITTFPTDPGHSTTIAATFDDKPAAVVSQFPGNGNKASTLGDLFVTYFKVHYTSFYPTLNYTQSIQFWRYTFADPVGRTGAGTWQALPSPYSIPNSVIQGIRVDVDPNSGRIYLSWVNWGFSRTVNVMTSDDNGASWSQVYTADPDFIITGSYNIMCSGGITNACNTSSNACLNSPGFLSTSFSAATQSLSLVYHRVSGTSPNPAEVVMQRFNPGSGFTTPRKVSGFDSTHQQWQGTVACSADASCVVSYYDHSAADPVMSYKVFARRVMDDGTPINGEDDVPLVNTLSDTCYNGNYMEYHDSTYRNGTWYAASTATATRPDNSVSGDVVVTAISCPPPVITQPVASPPTIQPGGSSTLSLTASGQAPLTANWYLTSGVLVGTSAFSGSSTTFVVQPSQTTTYTATVSNSCGVTNSQSVGVVVCTPPTVGILSASPATITAGQTSKLTSKNAAGGVPLTYSFYKSDGTFLGSSMSKNWNVTPTVTTSYYDTVTDTCGNTTGHSPLVTVTVQ